MQTFNLFKTPDTRYRESQKVLPYARASLGSVYLPNEFLFDPGIKEVTNGLCRCATFPFSTSHRMNNMYTGLKAVGYRKGREKNALMSLKEKRSQRENALEVMFQVKRGSFTRDPYFLPPSCFCEFIRFLILYSALSFTHLSFVLSRSLRGHWSSPYDPEIPTRSVSQVSTRINFRKRKSVLEDYGHASRKNLNIHAKI